MTRTQAHTGREGARVAGPDSTGNAAVGATFARVAGLLDQLAGAFRELAETGLNELDDGRNLSPVVSVAAPAKQREFVTARDLAQRLRVDPKTVRRWRDEGRLPSALTVGGVVRWRAEIIDEWIAEQEETT